MPPQLQQIHYLTDSPSSQYRNKTIFQVVCEHEKEFRVKARWNYLECGHGKGPCDGLGASVKRGADMAAKQEKCLIQDAADFFEWTKRSKGESKVKFMYYTEEEILKATNDLKEKNPVSTINGTMKVHAVVPVSLDTIAVRDLSCYCHDCLTNGNKSNCGWNEKIFVKSSEKVRKPAPTNIISEETLNSSKQTKAAYQEKNPKRKTPIVEANIADWVAAVYEEQWYIGQVTDIDKENDEIQVNFLEKFGRYEDTYKFPIRKDEIMIPNSDILIVLKNFLAVGKTKRTYKLGDEVKRSIIDKFAFWLAKTST